ncbi:MAG TPA: hypothetical protein VIE46_11315 [Gemmatimonadales bacterium]
MQRYWVRIALGAVAVFVVGMTLIVLVRHGLRRAETLAQSSRPIGIPLALLPFRLDGDQLGSVRRLELLRSAPKKVTGFRLVVRLQDSSTIDEVQGCTITVREPVAFGGRAGFTCTSPTDSAADHLEPIGEIVIEPGGVVRAILAPRAQAEEWRATFYDTVAAQAELAGLKAQRLADSSAAAVTIRADSTHAIIDIRGDSAKPLVQLQADSHGAVLRVHNKAGKEILRMHADSTGASLTVSPDSASTGRHQR